MERPSRPCRAGRSQFPLFLFAAFVARPLAIVLGSLSVAYAQGAVTVEWHAGRVAVHAADARLADVLGEVARRTGVEVEGVESLQERVSVRFEGLTLREALEQLLARRDYIVLGDLSKTAGQPAVRVVVLETRTGPPDAPAAGRAGGDVSVEPAADSQGPAEDEPGTEVAAPEEEAASEVEVVGEEGPETEQVTVGPVATLEEPVPMATAAPPVPVEGPEADAIEESAALEEAGTTIAVPEHEPESEVEILGEGEPEPD